MIRLVFIVLTLPLLALLRVMPVSAHAIHATADTGGVVVSASFADDAPAVGLFVSVFAPGESERFVSGKTDRNGCFAFMPDKSGDWDVLVYDRMGHRFELKVSVDASLLAQQGGKVENGWLVKGEKILAGIGLIALIFGSFGVIQRARSKGRSGTS